MDKFLDVLTKGYVKHFVNYHSPAEIVFNGWTLYDKNFITMNEFYLSVELMRPKSILVDIAEKGTTIEMERQEFYEMIKSKPPANG